MKKDCCPRDRGLSKLGLIDIRQAGSFYLVLQTIINFYTGSTTLEKG